MVNFSAKKIHGDKWEIWEHINGARRQVCVMGVNDILELFNKTVPHEMYEPYIEGDPDCKHTWRPWKFNEHFMVCVKCSARQKIKRLVPRTYE